VSQGVNEAVQDKVVYFGFNSFQVDHQQPALTEADVSFNRVFQN
jgi:hypothetical protein